MGRRRGRTGVASIASPRRRRPAAPVKNFAHAVNARDDNNVNDDGNANNAPITLRGTRGKGGEGTARWITGEEGEGPWTPASAEKEETLQTNVESIVRSSSLEQGRPPPWGGDVRLLRHGGPGVGVIRAVCCHRLRRRLEAEWRVALPGDAASISSRRDGKVLSGMGRRAIMPR